MSPNGWLVQVMAQNIAACTEATPRLSPAEIAHVGGLLRPLLAKAAAEAVGRWSGAPYEETGPMAYQVWILQKIGRERGTIEGRSAPGLTLFSGLILLPGAMPLNQVDVDFVLFAEIQHVLVA